MSVKANIETLSDEVANKIDDDMNMSVIKKCGSRKITKNYQFHKVNGNGEVILPFAYGKMEHKFRRPGRMVFSQTNVDFCIEPRPAQSKIISEAKSALGKHGCVMVSAYPGFGKTFCAIRLACTIRLKTLIVINKLVLLKQWEESIIKFCPNATVHCITTKTLTKPELKERAKLMGLATTGTVADLRERLGGNLSLPDADFYIVNAQNIEKQSDTFYADIGTVIVDEAHLIMAETLSRSLQYLFPRYLIGLTATPYRPDDLNCLLDLYFGEDNKLIRTLTREHIVYKVDTGFTPKVERTNDGTLNWGSVLSSQAESEKRNKLIVDLITRFADRNILVIVKRVGHGNYIENELRKCGESVTTLLGSNQEYDRDARVLIGTGQKVGVGFDHAKLDLLLLAADVEEYFIQYLGRVFRTTDGIPIVLDLVDNNSVLKKHFATRSSVYKKHGGTIKIFKH